jgi:DNA repair protein RecN (Recombination protein N)
MLTRIEIRDFALIEKIVMEPGRGLLILTGETGAGKSIIIDAIGALSGGRISREMVRHGQTTASIEAVFQIDCTLLPGALAADLGLDQDELILSREITASGKSACRINGRLAAMTALRELASCLIDIHGQHDQQAIFQVDRHLQILDHYAGDKVEEARAAYLSLLGQYKACQKEIDALGSDPAERARQIDLLSYQVGEITAAAIKPGEDETLAARRRILAHAEKIQAALRDGHERLNGDQGESVLTGIGSVLASLDAVLRHTDEVSGIAEAISNAQDILQTAASDLRAACEAFESDPGELERVDERLDILYRLKKKYGGSLKAVGAFLDRASEKLDRLSGGEARYEQLLAEKGRLAHQLLAAANRLSEQRRLAATGMEGKIAGELADLGMKGVRFAVAFADIRPDPVLFPEQGLDQVEYLLSANPGEPLRPLARIASGGEASRIMLAIKTILADVDQIPVLIFDEIDTGVSGQTAGKVGAKLLQLARGRQIFCITHMAQIAAMADEHWLIEKQVHDGRTKTGLRQLLEEERETELARLLSGGVADQTARQLAAQLRLQVKQ